MFKKIKSIQFDKIVATNLIKMIGQLQNKKS